MRSEPVPIYWGRAKLRLRASKTIVITARAYAGVTPLDQRYSAAYDSKEVTRSDNWDQRFKQRGKKQPPRVVKTSMHAFKTTEEQGAE